MPITPMRHHVTRELQVPAWPFIAASFATGVFALLPYFAVWDAPKKALELPPKKSELVRLPSAQPLSCRVKALSAWLPQRRPR